MDTVQTTANEMLAECDDDAIGLWVIVGRLESAGVAPALIRDTTLSVVRLLLRSGKVVIGQHGGTGFVRWELGPDDALERVAEEWRVLGRAPAPGEICWMLGSRLYSRHGSEGES